MRSENDALSLPRWIAHVFDHPVTEPAWYQSLDAPSWEDSPEHICILIAETFEGSGELLACFSDEQLNQGFWYLVPDHFSEFMLSLVDSAVPASVRLRALRSFVPLFEQVIAVRCSPHLSHLDEPRANSLNGACYMWWDLLPIGGRLGRGCPPDLDAEVLDVQRQILAILHDACRESALHGLGHWAIDYRRQVAEIIDQFLDRTPDLRRELVVYAEHARTGYIQ